MEIDENGNCHHCCKDWLPTPIGNIFQSSIEEIWNSPAAQEIRASIHDNSFRFCKTSHCEHLQRISGPVSPASAVEEFHFLELMEDKKVVLEFGPTLFGASYERSCNLACPTCRTEVFAAPLGNNPRLSQVHKNFLAVLPHLLELKITGSGDPFASPYFLQLLKQLRTEDYPRLRIYLHTNAQLLTEKLWDSLGNINRSFQEIEISIDAATAHTYSINRKGGSFPRLLQNLEFIGKKRREGKLKRIALSFVVQQNNWREMAQFVEMGCKYSADEVHFTRMVNWGTFSEEEYSQRAVFEPSHPEYPLLKAELEKPLFQEKIVNLANLSQVFGLAESKQSMETAHPEAFLQNEYPERV
jgi:MoaA/NifB/PqqE/SkfB family radical SAM enzyme